MDLIKSVYDISNDLLHVPTPVRIHASVQEDKLNELADQMLKDGKVNFYDKEPQEFSDEDIMHVIVRELVASSINYCYWYGTSLIRPMGSSSTTMYNLVDDALQFFDPQAFPGHIDQLISLLSFQRFPLLEERKRHLLELVEDGKAITFARFCQGKEIYGEMVFDELVKNFQGFSSDILLKRAALFMIQLYRQLGWFSDFMERLFVPADYQVPKMLDHFGVIKYSGSISYKIQESKLIEKGSLMECQIRAATIIACRKLSKRTGWNIADIDTWLWTKRKEPKGKFHLTITTDY